MLKQIPSQRLASLSLPVQMAIKKPVCIVGRWEKWNQEKCTSLPFQLKKKSFLKERYKDKQSSSKT